MIAIAKVAAAVVSLAITVACVVSFTAARPGMIMRSVIRPMSAAGVMAGVLLLVPATSFGPVADLALKVAVGALVYTPSMLALWAAAGYPDGPERLAMNILKRLATRKAGAPAG